MRLRERRFFPRHRGRRLNAKSTRQRYVRIYCIVILLFILLIETARKTSNDQSRPKQYPSKRRRRRANKNLAQLLCFRDVVNIIWCAVCIQRAVTAGRTINYSFFTGPFSAEIIICRNVFHSLPSIRLCMCVCVVIMLHNANKKTALVTGKLCLLLLHEFLIFRKRPNVTMAVADNNMMDNNLGLVAASLWCRRCCF